MSQSVVVAHNGSTARPPSRTSATHIVPLDHPRTGLLPEELQAGREVIIQGLRKRVFHQEAIHARTREPGSAGWHCQPSDSFDLLV